MTTLTTEEALLERLKAAEDVCVMYGWSASPPLNGSTDRQLATLELWMRWTDLVGGGFLGPDEHPDLAGAEVKLAKARRRTVAATLRKIDRALVKP